MSAVCQYASIRQLQELRAMPILQSMALTKDEEAKALAERTKHLQLDPQGKETEFSKLALETLKASGTNETLYTFQDASGCWLKSMLAKRTAALNQYCGRSQDLFTSHALHLAIAGQKAVHLALMLLYPEGKALINARQRQNSGGAGDILGNLVKIQELVKLMHINDAGGDSTKRGMTPLQMALGSGNPLILRLLLEQGADPTEQDFNHHDALQMAKFQLKPKIDHYEEIIAILTEALEKKEAPPKEESKETVVMDDYFKPTGS